MRLRPLFSNYIKGAESQMDCLRGLGVRWLSSREGLSVLVKVSRPSNDIDTVIHSPHCKISVLEAMPTLIRNNVLHGSLYAVKAQTSLAPLSWFPGSRVPTAHMHQCCRFQSYAKTVPSRMILTTKLTKREPTFLGSMTMDHVITACEVWL